jgi:hypothetical protein
MESIRLRCGRFESLQNQRMPKQITKATMERIRKRGRPHKRLRDKVEEDLTVMEVKDRETIVRGRRKWRKILLEAKVHSGLQCLRGRRRRSRRRRRIRRKRRKKGMGRRQRRRRSYPKIRPKFVAFGVMMTLETSLEMY